MKQKEPRLQIFVERLRELQGEKTNTEFAAHLGISRQTVGFYLNGDRIPDALVLRQIAERCSVSADWLLGLSDIKGIYENEQTAASLKLPESFVQKVCFVLDYGLTSEQLTYQEILGSSFFWSIVEAISSAARIKYDRNDNNAENIDIEYIREANSEVRHNTDGTFCVSRVDWVEIGRAHV